MDDAINWIALIIFGILMVWGLIKRLSGDYYEDEDGSGYNQSYSNDDNSNSSWGNSSQSSFDNLSYHNSSSSSSNHPVSNASPSVTKHEPTTKTFDSPKIQSHGGFGGGKK